MLLKLIKTLRCFGDIAPLIRAIGNSIYKIKYFIILTIMIDVCFALIFNLLYLKDLDPITDPTNLDQVLGYHNDLSDIEQYQTFRQSLFSMMQFGQLGDVDMNRFANTVSVTVTSFFYIVHVIVNLIVCLNLLIAILSEGYEETIEKSVAHRYKEKLYFIKELLCLQVIISVTLFPIIVLGSCFYVTKFFKSPIELWEYLTYKINPKYYVRFDEEDDDIYDDLKKSADDIGGEGISKSIRDKIVKESKKIKNEIGIHINKLENKIGIQNENIKKLLEELREMKEINSKK